MMKVVVALFLLILAPWTKIIVNPQDTYCSTRHMTTTKPPAQTVTAQDFYDLGNYDYDSGDCTQAIVAYTQSIHLNPISPETFNNRAYTYMRLHNYSAALSDLDTALTINPNYVTALMNQGDIYNFYIINRPKAIADYEQVIALGKEKDQSGSVCGHLAMARSNNVLPLAFLRLINKVDCK